MRYWMYVALSLAFAAGAFIALDYFWEKDAGIAVMVAAFLALLSAGAYPSSRKEGTP